MSSMSDPAAAPADEAGLSFASARGRWVLLATVLGSAIASIDATVVGIALPAIGREFGVGLADLQWVVTAYTMTLAGLLLLAGSLGDKYGRKRGFLIGVIWFALASLLCSIAPTAGTLIAARALQGVGAALLTPGSLAILEAVFRPDDRGRAIGAWSGFSGVGTAIGPFIGGWLVQAVSWRLIFVINLPLAALVVAVTLRHVPESRDPGATAPVDASGGVLVTAGLIGLTYGLIQGPVNGWASTPVLAALIVGVLLLGVFGWWERRAPAPMLSLSLFASAPFTATNARAPAPPELSGMAWAANNEVAGAAALTGAALLPAAGGITGNAYRNAPVFSAGFHTASLVSAGLCVAGGLLAAATIRNPTRAEAALRPAQEHPLHCAIDAPPQPVLVPRTQR